MTTIQKTCDPDVKRACRSGYAGQVRAAVEGKLCERERTGTVEACPDRQPMECGHARAFTMRGDYWGKDDQGLPNYTWWCSKCSQEAGHGKASV